MNAASNLAYLTTVRLRYVRKFQINIFTRGYYAICARIIIISNQTLQYNVGISSTICKWLYGFEEIFVINFFFLQKCVRFFFVGTRFFFCYFLQVIQQYSNV